MNKILTTLILMAISFGTLQAQFFNISNIETNKFPRVSTIFVAKDGNNEFIKNATAKQFIVEEDGFTIPEVDLRIECFEGQDVPELSIVIVVDKSGSMLTPFDINKPNETPWIKVREGVEAFLKNIKFVGRTQASLVTFSGTSVLACPFTNNPEDILDSLKNENPSGSTKYDPPFIKAEYINNGETMRESAVALLKTRPTNIKRIVVFLTDGLPNNAPSTDEIIDSLNTYNISAYNISFLTTMDPSLYEIAERTNGSAYLVEKKEDLVHIYSEIAIAAQKSYFCELSWLAKYPCYESQRLRDVNVTFKGTNPYGRGSRSYLVPEDKLPIRSWEKKTYSFGNPEVGPNNSVIKTLQLSIDRVDFSLENLEIVPSGEGFKVVGQKDSKGNIVTDNSVLKEGDTLFVDIEFEQFGTKTLRTATLTANGEPCFTATGLVGGTTDVILESPNGDEVFTTCDEVNINWSGIDRGTQVHVSYSKDNFKNDSNFVATTNNSNYLWNNPPNTPGDYKIKLRVDPVARYIYAVSDKGKGRSHGSSIALSKDELFVYSCGNYNDAVIFDNTILNNDGNEDIFLAKHNSAGKLIWANTLGGIGLDSAAGVCVDDAEQIYITGATSKGAKFGSANPSIPLGGSAFFIAKTSPNGTNYVVRTISAQSPYITGEAWGTKIRFDESSQLIVVQGGYKNDFNFVTSTKTYSFKGSGRFTAYYDKNLNLENIQMAAIGGTYSSNEAVTSDGKSTYKIGTLAEDKTFGNILLKHNGKNDAYITRFGFNEPSEDVSEKSFKIEKPTLKFTETGPLVFNDTPLDAVTLLPKSKIVINSSILPIQIDSVTITGVNKDNFYLDRAFDGIIESGVNNAKDLNINFNPKTDGPKIAVLNIYGVCTDVITIELKGNGICDLVIADTINLGATNVNLTSTRIDNKVFYNNNNVTVRITPQIINDANNEFKIISINGDPSIVGNSLTIAPYDSVSIELSFTPKSEGSKTAKLAYKPETSGCADITSTLVGVGANTDLAYAVVNFDRKRIKTINTLYLEITNAGKLDVELTDVNVNSNSPFKLKLPTDLTVKTSEPLIIEVIFNPQIDGNYSEPINIIINPGDSPISLNNVVGIGENPTAIGSIDCFAGGVQNTTTPVSLILSNTSKVAITEVKSITLSPTSNYTFVGGSKTSTVVPDIAINNSVPIALEFTPTIPGTNELVYTIVSNTAVGNNLDDKVNDPLTFIDTLECDALPNTGEKIVTFNGVLVCDMFAKTESLINQDVSKKRTVDRYEILPSGTDFSVDLPNGQFDIPAATPRPFRVLFSPMTTGLQTAKLTIYYQDGVNEVINLSGTGKRIRFYTSKPNIDVVPGSEMTLKVMADIPVLDYRIDNLDIRLKHNPEVTSFKNDINGNVKLPLSNSINWIWSNSNNINSSEYIDFNGTPSTATDELTSGTIELFEINYIMYLGPIKNDDLQVAYYFENCNNNEFNSLQKVNLSGVCALDKRLIQIGILPEQSITTYNGNINLIRTEFTVMYDDLEVNFEILDLNGNLVTSKNINSLTKGRYESVIDATNISSGLYFVRFVSGAYSDTQKLMIVK